MVGLKEITEAFDVNRISETYPGPIEITDLRDELGTRGHILVIRGDRAYADRLGENKDLANPKFWMYENLINSPRIQEQLQANPNHKLFDGVGFSSLEALGYHAKRLGRKAVVVMTYNFVADAKISDRYNIGVIYADEPAEEGYVKKQAEVLSQRNDLIPLHQALNGTQAMAPIGNKVVKTLEEMSIAPNETFWCLASGSNLYGIGEKIRKRFGSKTAVVEPNDARTIDPDLDLSNKEAVRDHARQELRNYSNENWNKIYSGIFPLHISHPNRYLLLNWLHNGNVGFDKTTGVDAFEATKTQRLLKRLNPNYDWTNTTAQALVPAIEAAREGKDVLVMAYGKYRKHKTKDVTVINSPPWILRGETATQKVALTAASLAWMATGVYYVLNIYPRAPSFIIN